MTEEIRTLLDDLATASDAYANCLHKDRQKRHAEVFTLALQPGEAWSNEVADAPSDYQAKVTA